MRENKVLELETGINTLIKNCSPDSNRPVFTVKMIDDSQCSLAGYGSEKDRITTLISCIKTLDDQRSEKKDADKLDFIEKQLSFMKKNLIKMGMVLNSNLKSLKDSKVDEKLLTEYLELLGLQNASTIVHLFYWLDKDSYTLEKALNLISPKQETYSYPVIRDMSSINSNRVIDHLRKCIDKRPSNNKTTQTEFNDQAKTDPEMLRLILKTVQEQKNLITELQAQMANMQTQISRLAIPDSAETKRSPTLFK